MDRLVLLPHDLLRRARTPGRKRCAAARDAQIAVALEILLMAARRANLANLQLGKHVLIDSARPDRVQLVIDEDETKNESVLDMELPPESGRLLRLYVERFLPDWRGRATTICSPAGAVAPSEPRLAGQADHRRYLQATGCGSIRISCATWVPSATSTPIQVSMGWSSACWATSRPTLRPTSTRARERGRGPALRCRAARAPPVAEQRLGRVCGGGSDGERQAIRPGTTFRWPTGPSRIGSFGQRDPAG